MSIFQSVFTTLEHNEMRLLRNNFGLFQWMDKREKRNLINAYYLLRDDLKEILSFIEPTQDNFKTYSHQLNALFIRACMEFAASCKMIFIENKYDLREIKIPIYSHIIKFMIFQIINLSILI